MMKSEGSEGFVQRRRTAREKMATVFYQLDLMKVAKPGELSAYLPPEDIPQGQKHYCENVFAAYKRDLQEADRRIGQSSRNWKLSRMPKMDLAILRLAVLEILDMDNIDAAVSINEAVELAKIYGEEKSPAFVNAVLGKIARSIQDGSDPAAGVKAEKEEAEKDERKQEDAE